LVLEILNRISVGLEDKKLNKWLTQKPDFSLSVTYFEFKKEIDFQTPIACERILRTGTI
jgi:hypothetical protein